MKDKFKEAYIHIAEHFASLSHAKKIKVGCVIVKDNRILSIGYNGMPAGWDNECEEESKWPNGDTKFLTTKKEVLHAEANALMKLCQSTESSKDASLYATHTPCIECAKLIHQAGIKEVYVRNEYLASKGSGMEFLERSGITVTKLPKE